MLQKTAAKIDPIFLITVIVNLALPKAGIKLAGVPITVGNLLFAFLLVYTLYARNVASCKLTVTGLLYIVSCFFWVIRLGIAIVLSKGSLFNETLGYIVPLTIFPLILFITPLYITRIEQVNRLLRVIFWCLLALFIYTLLQFAFGIERTAIPGITVNYTDYAQSPSGWWTNKSNAVGDSTKLVATYQNGNLLGVNLLLLFPAGLTVLKKPTVKLIYWAMLIGCVLLSGSRTVYVGLAFMFVFYGTKSFYTYFFKNKSFKMRSFVFILTAVILCATGAVIFILQFDKVMIDRVLSLFDFKTLQQSGGRTQGFIEYFSWLKEHPLAIIFGGYGLPHEGFAYEITYLAVFLLGGIIGLILFIAFIFRALKQLFKSTPPPYKNLLDGLTTGLIVYFVSALIDGGYWLPPTALNVWFIAGFAVAITKLGKNNSPGLTLPLADDVQNL